MCCDNCSKKDSKYHNCDGDKLCQKCAEDWIAERVSRARLGEAINVPLGIDNGKMRTFNSGAVRDTSINKLDYEACLSQLVLKRYAEYVRSCRVQPDGNIRADDNWQKGFGLAVWMKSKWRHLMHTWTLYRTRAATITDKDGKVWDIEKSLCAELFNTHGMLHEILKRKVSESELSAVEIASLEAQRGA